MINQQNSDFFYVFFSNILLILVVGILYHFIFVRKGIKFPGPEYGSIFLIKNSFQVIKHNWGIMRQFDELDIIRSCGIEGYYYLYYQKSMIKMLLTFMGINIISIYFSPKLSFLLVDKYFTSDYQLTMTSIYVGLLLFTCKSMLDHVYSIKIDDQGQEQQIQHTLHIWGLNTNLDQRSIIEEINNIIGQKGCVVSISFIAKYPIKQLKKQKEQELQLQCQAHLPIVLNKEKIEIPPIEMSSGHVFVTFDKEEAIIYLKENYAGQEDCLVVNHSLSMFVMQAPHPLDIAYINFNSSVKMQVLRKILINILMILLLIFFTTPSSVLQIIGFQLKHQQTAFFRYLSLLLVVLLNVLLLFLIDLAAKWEKHTSKSQYQISIFGRSSLYLTMNMFVIPALSFLAVNNIYDIIIKDTPNLISIIQAVYFLQNGSFFIAIIFQSACVSLITILRLDEIVLSWFNVTYAELKRETYKKYPYLQSLPDMFTYGYYYGLEVCVMYIVMTFSTNIPLIHWAGLFYFLCRYYVDILNLQTVFGEELNSNRKLPKKVIISTACSCIPLQVVNLVMFALKQEAMSTLVQLGILAFTVIIILYLQNIMRQGFSNVFVKNDELYRHPLQN